MRAAPHQACIPQQKGFASHSAEAKARRLLSLLNSKSAATLLWCVSSFKRVSSDCIKKSSRTLANKMSSAPISKSFLCENWNGTRGLKGRLEKPPSINSQHLCICETRFTPFLKNRFRHFQAVCVKYFCCLLTPVRLLFSRSIRCFNLKYVRHHKMCVSRQADLSLLFKCVTVYERRCVELNS